MFDETIKLEIMKKILFILAILASANAIAQQNAQYQQYIFNELVINPAYAGTKEFTNMSAIYSNQWAGLEGSPSTQTLALDGAFSNRVGLGFHLLNDKIGAQSQQAFFFSYAYRIPITEKLKLSLGIAAGASFFTLDGTKLLTDDGVVDPAIPTATEYQARFDSKTGLFLYSDRFYTGFSVSDLLSDVIRSKDLLIAKQARHYYLTSGYIFDLSPKFKFKPSFLFKEDFEAPSVIDINSFFLYNERVWLGATARFGAKIFSSENLDNTLRLRNGYSFMIEYYITDRFRAGYAYTHSLTVLKSYPGHEIALGLYFPNKVGTKMKSPRYF
jgi:type IX secretion system PorP/SprF family membrane protein